MAPTPGPGGTDIHVPGPGDVDPQKGFDAIAGAPTWVWTVVAGLIIIGIIRAVFGALNWKVIGPILLLVILFIIFGNKFH
jgi:hypothetical protein